MEKFTEVALEKKANPNMVPLWGPVGSDDPDMLDHFIENLKVAVETSPVVKLCNVRDEILEWMQKGETLIATLDDMINAMANVNDLGLETNAEQVLAGRRKIVLSYKKGLQIMEPEAEEPEAVDTEVSAIAESLPELDPALIAQASLVEDENGNIAIPDDIAMAPDAELDSTITMGSTDPNYRDPEQIAAAEAAKAKDLHEFCVREDARREREDLPFKKGDPSVPVVEETQEAYEARKTQEWADHQKRCEDPNRL